MCFVLINSVFLLLFVLFFFSTSSSSFVFVNCQESSQVDRSGRGEAVVAQRGGRLTGKQFPDVEDAFYEGVISLTYPSQRVRSWRYGDVVLK